MKALAHDGLSGMTTCRRDGNHKGSKLRLLWNIPLLTKMKAYHVSRTIGVDEQNSMRNIYLVVLWSLLVGLTACKSKAGEQAKSAGAAPQEYTTVDPATASTIRGTIKFNGKAPAPREIDMSADPACQFADGPPAHPSDPKTGSPGTPPGPKLSEQYVVNDGKLANVYVYIKEGLEGKNFAPLQAPAVLDQRGCRYHPHVLAMMAGQPLRILNSDPATHNVHPSPKVDGNHEWNVSQMPKGDPVEKTFTQPEIMMPVQCNQHNWMKAYINVSKTPFFAVSDAAGNFEIKGLPPGEYTVAAVHEKAGEQTQKINVGPSETKQAEFVFGAK